MRSRIAPFLPAHVVLVLAIAYAAGSLWIGHGRLAAITRVAESTAQSAATMQDLASLLIAVHDIETAGRAFVLHADDAYLAIFERGQRDVAPLLADLRDRMRDDPAELAMIERLVPLISQRTDISATAIERKRSAPDKPFEIGVGQRGKESADEIRAIVTALDVREREQLVRDRQILAAALDDATRDLYLMLTFTLLLVVLLHLTLRRLKSFLPPAPADDAARRVDLSPSASAISRDAGVGTLLRDALVRVRLATAAAAPGSPQCVHLQALAATMEQARREHAVVEQDLGQPRYEEESLVHAIALLAAGYSRPAGLAVAATIDQSIRVDDTERAFLIFRSAEWALEAITLRKRGGEVSLQMSAQDDEVILRIFALADQPDEPLALTPKEAEAAEALQHAIAAHGGIFLVRDSPTGFVLTLRVAAANGRNPA